MRLAAHGWGAGSSCRLRASLLTLLVGSSLTVADIGHDPLNLLQTSVARRLLNSDPLAGAPAGYVLRNTPPPLSQYSGTAEDIQRMLSEDVRALNALLQLDEGSPEVSMEQFPAVPATIAPTYLAGAAGLGSPATEVRAAVAPPPLVGAVGQGLPPMEGFPRTSLATVQEASGAVAGAASGHVKTQIAPAPAQPAPKAEEKTFLKGFPLKVLTFGGVLKELYGALIWGGLFGIFVVGLFLLCLARSRRLKEEELRDKVDTMDELHEVWTLKPGAAARR